MKLMNKLFAPYMAPLDDAGGDLGLAPTGATTSTASITADTNTEHDKAAERPWPEDRERRRHPGRRGRRDQKKSQEAAHPEIASGQGAERSWEARGQLAKQNETRQQETGRTLT